MRRRLLIAAMCFGFVAAWTHAAEAGCCRGRLFRGKGRQAVKATLRGVARVLPPYRHNGHRVNGSCSSGVCR